MVGEDCQPSCPVNQVPVRNDTERRSQMHISNLYADENGESHFRDLEVDWAEDRGHSQLSETVPATGIIFRRTASDYNLDWHPAPRRQYIVNLDAAVQIRASDGEVRIIKAGEIFLVEDTHGKGHLSSAVDGKERHSLFIPIE